MSSSESFPSKPISRIAIVGVGQVGAAAAYALILGSVANELLLVDVKTEKRDSQVRDLSDIVYSGSSGTRVRAATYEEAGQCDIIVVTAGSKYSIGETSVQHMYKKMAIIQSVIHAMQPIRSDAILLIVANPVDFLTSFALSISGLPASQVLGSGTFLDSVRLRGLLADKAEVAANSIDLYVLGVHGESQVVAWSTATIGGVPIDKSLPTGAVNHAGLEEECKHRSLHIVRAKGATPFGIGYIVSSICSSILFDKHNVRPISHYQPEYGCCFSLPVIVGRQGIIRTIHPPLTSAEQTAISDSAKALKAAIDRVQENM